MNNIVWKTKYTTYPFELPDGVNGNIIVKDKGGIQITLDNSQNNQSIKFKNLEKAMIYINTDLIKHHLK